MNNFLVSIIIPIYNRAHIVKKTLDSITKQSYTNWECVIVDDGSTDHTLDVLQSYQQKDNRFKIYKRPSNYIKGANACRNFGFLQSKGAYINWFDSDDVMLKDFIKLKVEAVTTNTNAVISRNRYANANFTQFRESKFNFSEDTLFKDYALETIELQTCSFLWEKQYLQDKKLFDPQITRYQDNEFHIRMLANKPKLIVLNHVLATIRSGNSDQSQISSLVEENSIKILDIFYYRYQCLKLAFKTTLWNDKTFKRTIAKKAFWMFYSGLKKEKQLKNRIGYVFKYKDQLKFLYTINALSTTEKLKSKGLIIKRVLFR